MTTLNKPVVKQPFVLQLGIFQYIKYLLFIDQTFNCSLVCIFEGRGLKVYSVILQQSMQTTKTTKVTFSRFSLILFL